MRPPRPKRINDRLEIGWDADHDPGDPKDWKVMLTTRPGRDDHEHFVLTTSQATQLYKWLERFFKKARGTMTVKQLILELQKLNQKAKVTVSIGDPKDTAMSDELEITSSDDGKTVDISGWVSSDNKNAFAPWQD